MSEKKIIVPQDMLNAADRALLPYLTPMHYLTSMQRDKILIEGALKWLDVILHESNGDFHRAILEAERNYFPGRNDDCNTISRRVDFEYGVSFARNYIRNLFVEPEPEIDEEIKDLFVDNDYRPLIAKSINERIEEAYRRGQKAGTK